MYQPIVKVKLEQATITLLTPSIKNKQAFKNCDFSSPFFIKAHHSYPLGYSRSPLSNTKSDFFRNFDFIGFFLVEIFEFFFVSHRLGHYTKMIDQEKRNKKCGVIFHRINGVANKLKKNKKIKKSQILNKVTVRFCFFFLDLSFLNHDLS